MRVTGVTELSRFIEGPSARVEAVALRSWLCEAEANNWEDMQGLQRAYPTADISNLPYVVFWIADGDVGIETVVCLEKSILLIRAIWSGQNSKRKKGRSGI